MDVRGSPVWISWCVALWVGCQPPPSAAAKPSPAAPVSISTSTASAPPTGTLDLSEGQRDAVRRNERLAGKLRGSAYDFFRFQHEAFTEVACRLMADERHRMPLVNLHGDAHLEQYATTQLGFGLNDFDEAGFGPATVDLLRFGVSILLACRDATFSCDPDVATRVFMAAYREATLSPRPPQSVLPGCGGHGPAPPRLARSISHSRRAT